MKGTPERTIQKFRAVGEVGIQIMVQDAPRSGVEPSVPLLVWIAWELVHARLFKVVCAQSANMLRALIAEGSDPI